MSTGSTHICVDIAPGNHLAHDLLFARLLLSILLTDPCSHFFFAARCSPDAFKLDENPTKHKKEELLMMVQAVGNTTWNLQSVNRWLARERRKKRQQPLATKQEDRRRKSRINVYYLRLDTHRCSSFLYLVLCVLHRLSVRLRGAGARPRPDGCYVQKAGPQFSLALCIE